MLKNLSIKNFALISEADIEFDSGLNVLSGETGSGKSIILDSINFVLGSKADKTMIRFGENEAIVRAEFIVDSNSEANKKLEELDIDSDETIIISRRLSLEGKNSIKINGCPVTVSMLKSVTQYLVDVHGQSEHFFLLNEANQLKVLDGLLGATADRIKVKLSEFISAKRALKAKVTALGGDEAERVRKLELLEYQINEIESANLRAGEYNELKSRQNLIINTEKILASIEYVKNILNGDGGCCDGLSSAIREMNRISDIGDDYSQLSSRLESLSTEAIDISETLLDLEDSLSFDENEAQAIDERLSLIKSLQRKYGYDEEEIIAFKDRAKTEYEILSDSAAAIEKYNREINELDDKIYNLCIEISDLRKQAAMKFCSSVEAELKTLNIPNAKFNVNFKAFDKSTANLCSVNGCDDIQFEFSANKGEPLKPLSKVISGGEMSRFMLAIKTQLKDLNGISTYIFDEIDSGISGFTAVTVAKKFLKISETTQILAVSHLPQVCAASTCQLLIYKIDRGGKTYTEIKKLNEKQKIEEIVRLTGGVLSETALKHAQELIGQFRKV